MSKPIEPPLYADEDEIARGASWARGLVSGLGGRAGA